MERFRAIEIPSPQATPHYHSIEGVLNQHDDLDEYDLVTVIPTTRDDHTRTTGFVAVFQRRSE